MFRGPNPDPNSLNPDSSNPTPTPPEVVVHGDGKLVPVVTPEQKQGTEVSTQNPTPGPTFCNYANYLTLNQT